jgi:hypothetical protein
MFEGVKDSTDWFVSFRQGLYPNEEGFVYIYDQEDYEDMVSTGRMTWDEIEREFGCSFKAGTRGAYYVDQIEAARDANRIGNFTYNENSLVDTYWDIGSSDDAPVWFKQTDNNRIIFFDYCDNAGKGVRDYVTLLADKGYRYRTHYLPHDAGHKTVGQDGKSTAEIFEDLLDAYQLTGMVEVLPKSVNKQNGINDVRSRFSRYHFDEERCHLGIRHIEAYSRAWDRHNRVFRKEPKHDEHSHAADALRYEAEAGDSGPWERTPKDIKVLTGLDIGDL